ncbi:type II toxin-antitoxin system mRNA interferase toxin, RelE/StbE family [uncultured Dialister sp.]|uniref:type II toxin-antitoxin system mRNA interferase toxin, RelE/StbE family n=1 Tax=uncultured Dialister sp. TaxID=278064 RepID=UPI0035A8F3E8
MHKNSRIKADNDLISASLGFRECHVKPDRLLIYMIENDILTLTLTATGSHADLFHM